MLVFRATTAIPAEANAYLKAPNCCLACAASAPEPPELLSLGAALDVSVEVDVPEVDAVEGLGDAVGLDSLAARASPSVCSLTWWRSSCCVVALEVVPLGLARWDPLALWLPDPLLAAAGTTTLAACAEAAVNGVGVERLRVGVWTRWRL